MSIPTLGLVPELVLRFCGIYLTALLESLDAVIQEAARHDNRFSTSICFACCKEP